MKKIMSILVLCSVALMPLQHVQATNGHKPNSGGINGYNGTGQVCSIVLNGTGGYYNYSIPTGGFSVGSFFTPGTYLITMSCPSSGSHTFSISTQSGTYQQTTSNGSATFNLYISTSITAMYY